MQLPIIRGLIDRRILVNYRVDPDVLAPLLPEPFRPKLVGGFGLVGICMIRLKEIRPRFLPAWLGIGSENVAHRVAVEWDENGTVQQGVFVRRRDTNSRLNLWAGGRIFPGYHHHARFTVEESVDRYHVSLRSDDGVLNISVRGHVADQLPATSVFRSLDEALAFFEAGSLGYSTTPTPSRFQGMELRCRNWGAKPLAIDEVRSSYFDDASIFPRGSIELDSALLMRGIEHEWHVRQDLCCSVRHEAAPLGA